MVESKQSGKTLHADPEHGGLRVTIITVLILGLAIGFLLLQLLINTVAANTQLADFVFILSCIGSIPLALGGAWAVERFLKNRWHSGTRIDLEDESFQLLRSTANNEELAPGNGLSTFEWSKHLSIIRWYFRLEGYPRAGRERRVSNKSLCLACSIQQDSSRLVVYGYLPADDAAVLLEDLGLSEPFYFISLAELYHEAGKRRSAGATRPTIPAAMLTRKDGRYWLAEQSRWLEGVELTANDFAAFMDYIEAHTKTSRHSRTLG